MCNWWNTFFYCFVQKQSPSSDLSEYEKLEIRKQRADLMSKSADLRNIDYNPYKKSVRKRTQKVRIINDKENKILIKDWIS